ncbi:MAG: cyclic nucleotide-binding domain-containing protein [Clostridiales bacterium]|nr:cyclic nucleotide-binding domain-containing protein [Clostridiales bacterium]
MSVVEKSFYKGEVIVKEGDIGDSFFRLIEGKASVYADWDKKDQEPFRIALLDTGEYFGEMAIIEAYPRNATIVAVGNVRVIEIPKDDLTSYFQENPDQILVLMKHLGNRIKAMSNDYNDAKALLKEVKEAEAAKKKSLFSRIKKHVDMYESNKDTIAPPPSAEVIAQVFETITDEGSGDIRGCEANTIIYDEGSVDDCMFILRNGVVGMYDSNKDKISELTPVSLFGEMGMLVGEPREATAVAETDDTYVEVITPDYLETIFNACPVKIELILRQLSYRLRVLNYDVITTCKEITEAYNK